MQNETMPSGPEDTFPYRAKFARPSSAQFRALCIEDHARTTYALDGSVRLEASAGAWDDVDGLADMYNEKTRILSRLLRASTPMERWLAFELLSSAEKEKKLGEVTRAPPFYVRDVHVWRQRESINGPECTQFRPSVAKAFYVVCSEWLAGKRDLHVLDPCAGYGDRFLGAMASGVVARAKLVDPNPELHSGYHAMLAELRDFAPARTMVLETCCLPFERAEVEGDSFDVVFTSPPFFDKEKYYAPGSLGQAEALPGPPSPRKWRETWTQLWYKPFLKKALAAVRPGGILGLYVCDTTSGKLEGPTVREVGRLGGLPLPKVEVGRRRTLPILCFTKIAEVASISALTTPL
jgi:hypothetical protein